MHPRQRDCPTAPAPSRRVPRGDVSEEQVPRGRSVGYSLFRGIDSLTRLQEKEVSFPTWSDPQNVLAIGDGYAL